MTERTIKSTTAESVEKTKGGFIKTITQSTFHYYRHSRLFRYSVLTYFSIFLFSQLFGTYYDGKNALLEYRDKSTSLSLKEEWQAVKKGCSEHSWDRFWGSVFWPGHIWSNVMPGLIMTFNKAS